MLAVFSKEVRYAIDTNAITQRIRLFLRHMQNDNVKRPMWCGSKVLINGGQILAVTYRGSLLVSAGFASRCIGGSTICTFRIGHNTFTRNVYTEKAFNSIPKYELFFVQYDFNSGPQTGVKHPAADMLSMITSRNDRCMLLQKWSFNHDGLHTGKKEAQLSP